MLMQRIGILILVFSNLEGMKPPDPIAIMTYGL